jgi:glycosyltransferase involved in cell wall biosynthesis
MNSPKGLQFRKSPIREIGRLRVAIVHDWLVVYAGAERVLEQMLEILPQADLFAVVDFLEPDARRFIRNKPVTTTFIQKLPGARRHYRSYLPLMPLAIEQLDLSGYDLVISSSASVAKGVITGPDQLHVCMCYSPMRYAWDLTHQYLRESKLTSGLKSWLTRWLLHRIRMWDYRTANGVDEFIAISKFIGRRIHKVYGRESTVIYPPVDVFAFAPADQREEFYVTASRMVPYKRIDLIVEAFAQMPDRKLVVIGDGPEFARIKKIATPNVQLLGYQPYEVLKSHLQRAKAFVFAAEEDFGIAPLEASACGTPVIAFGRGGARETVLDGQTGVLFEEQTVESIRQGIERFERLRSQFDTRLIRRHAEKFSAGRFRDQFVDFLEDAVARQYCRQNPTRQRVHLRRMPAVKPPDQPVFRYQGEDMATSVR